MLRYLISALRYQKEDKKEAKRKWKKVNLLAFICTLSTVNDVTKKDPLERPGGIFTDFVGAFHLQRSLKSFILKLESSFQVKYLHRSCKDPSGYFPATPLTVHSVCNYVSRGRIKVR